MRPCHWKKGKKGKKEKVAKKDGVNKHTPARRTIPLGEMKTNHNGDNESTQMLKRTIFAGKRNGGKENACSPGTRKTGCYVVLGGKLRSYALIEKQEAKPNPILRILGRDTR